MQCSPGNKGQQLGSGFIPVPGHVPSNQMTCYSLRKLKKMADSYNKYYPQSIPISYSGMNADELWTELQKRLSKECGNNEVCWVRQPFAKKSGDTELLKFTFKPPKPKGKYMWLSTSDIEDVMKQYEAAYPEFKFIGPVPIDFMKVMPDLVLLDFAKLLKNGITKIGIIFNTDPSYRDGEHWISMFINLSPPKPSISFYDSVAICPAPSEVRKYIDYIIGQTDKLQKVWGAKCNFTINCNNVKHQRKNSECGVYSMFYITESLRGKSFKQISNNIIRDEEMNANRDKFFSPI